MENTLTFDSGDLEQPFVEKYSEIGCLEQELDKSVSYWFKHNGMTTFSKQTTSSNYDNVIEIQYFLEEFKGLIFKLITFDSRIIYLKRELLVRNPMSNIILLSGEILIKPQIELV